MDDGSQAPKCSAKIALRDAATAIESLSPAELQAQLDLLAPAGRLRPFRTQVTDETMWRIIGTCSSGERAVSSRDLHRDPAGVVRMAMNDGPVVVVDERGRPRIRISVPRGPLPAYLD